MPTTFSAFIKKAIALGEEAAQASLDAEAAASPIVEEVSDAEEALPPKTTVKKKAPPAMPNRPSKPSKADREPQAEMEPEKDKKAKQKKKNWKAAQLLGFDDSAGGDGGPGGNKKSDKKKKKENVKYTEAAASDGINEMNPMMIQDKMKEAQHKLNPDNIDMPSKLVVSQKGSRRSLIKDKPKRGITKQPSLEDIATKPDKESGDAITFTPNELVALQMLFLLVDHRDKGFITVADLVQWSAEEGIAVRESEAELCVNYLDFDMDSRIGFEDYLVFAAKNKDNWLITQYHQVMTQIKKINPKELIPPPPPKRD